MSRRQQIISIGTELILSKGYNAFSFADISNELKIKKASIHYHFPTKQELGVSIIKHQQNIIHQLIDDHKSDNPLIKLIAFFSVYDSRKSKQQVCLVGSLATDFNTIDEGLKVELRQLSSIILNWVIEILEEGKDSNIFHFTESPRTKALLIITNILAALQLSRLTGEEDFEIIKSTLIQNIIQ